MGYSWSIWLVPFDYTEIQKDYDMVHIPHVTLTTRQTLENCLNIFHRMEKNPLPMVRFEGVVVEFPDMYGFEVLKALGWYATSNFPTVHRQHMSLCYWNSSESVDVNEYSAIPPRGQVPCFISIADTTSDDPRNWKLYP